MTTCPCSAEVQSSYITNMSAIHGHAGHSAEPRDADDTDDDPAAALLAAAEQRLVLIARRGTFTITDPDTEARGVGRSIHDAIESLLLAWRATTHPDAEDPLARASHTDWAMLHDALAAAFDAR